VGGGWWLYLSVCELGVIYLMASLAALVWDGMCKSHFLGSEEVR
jgi:hypothetical protein